MFEPQWQFDPDGNLNRWELAWRLNHWAGWDPYATPIQLPNDVDQDRPPRWAWRLLIVFCVLLVWLVVYYRKQAAQAQSEAQGQGVVIEYYHDQLQRRELENERALGPGHRR